MGSFIAACNKKGEEFKANIIIAVTMTCSFFAGMMMQGIQYIIAKHVPILSYINPVNLITDGLYSLYYYTGHERFFMNVIFLTIFSIIFSAGSYFFIRRKKYDSI
jgi:ABC-2 type transport system permease protein